MDTSKSAENETKVSWNITGADAKTGKDISVTIDASSESDALRAAKERGIFVASICQQEAVAAATSSSNSNDRSSRRRLVIITVGFPLLVAAVIAILVGFDKRTAAEKDPLGNFRSFAAEYMKNLNSVVKNQKTEGWIETIIDEHFTVDVEKTDSLASPYLATLIFTRMSIETESAIKAAKGNGPLPPTGAVKETLVFALQDGKWILKDATFKGVFTSGKYQSDLIGSDFNDERLHEAWRQTQQE